MTELNDDLAKIFVAGPHACGQRSFELLVWRTKIDNRKVICGTTHLVWEGYACATYTR
jgi:hypothetical protein